MRLAHRKVRALLLLLLLSCSAAMTVFLTGALNSQEPRRRITAWQIHAQYLGTQGVTLQDKMYNCGAAALEMILIHHKIPMTMAEIENEIGQTDLGTNMSVLKVLAERKGLRASGWKYESNDLLRLPAPAILFLHGNHFAVFDSVASSGSVYLRDPAIGRIVLDRGQLEYIWNGETLIFQRE
jgi:ABC-type bacteriocin/lantibiotic exporter with double-glycine peptidase domain